jgi:alkylation response protein AidB-like acyl-CoA dehydrogenase
MDDHDTVRELVRKLMDAVEASIAGSPAVREALAELAGQGYAARLFVASRVAEAAEAPEPGDRDWMAFNQGADEPGRAVRELGTEGEADEARPGFTRLDRDFLRSASIRPETA